MKVLSLFDYTGNMVKPWAEAGHDCTIVDIQHEGDTREGNIRRIQADMSEWWPDEDYDLLFCFPPCTDLAVSGARWFKKKEADNPGTRERAMNLVYRCRDIGESLGCPYFIENPVSVISSEWRKPDFTFHPWQYSGWCDADQYTKKTCLWAGNGWKLPPFYFNSDVSPDDRIHKAPPGPERANFRSATPMGFAYAVYYAS